MAAETLKEQGTPEIRIATVTNFPHGNDDIDIALAETYERDVINNRELIKGVITF